MTKKTAEEWADELLGMLADVIDEAIAVAVADEREECARLCVRRSCNWNESDDERSHDFREGIEVAASQLAEAIRARAKQISLPTFAATS